MTDPHRHRVLRRAAASSLLSGLHVHSRLMVAAAVAVALLTLVPAAWGTSLRLAIAWNAGGLTYLGLAAALMSTCTTDVIRLRAAKEDEARLVFFGLILIAIVSSLYAVFALIAEAKTLTGDAKLGHILLAALTIIVSWLVMQIVFTLHYAHEYYAKAHTADGAIRRGMNFPDDTMPDYWDFFYFTTSIGATSQTSDVAITSKSVRRMVAFQAVLSFAFNTTVVALAINLASGLL